MEEKRFASPLTLTKCSDLPFSASAAIDRCGKA